MSVRGGDGWALLLLIFSHDSLQFSINPAERKKGLGPVSYVCFSLGRGTAMPEGWKRLGRPTRQAIRSVKSARKRPQGHTLRLASKSFWTPFGRV